MSGVLVAHLGFRNTYIGTGCFRMVCAMAFIFLRDVPEAKYKSMDEEKHSDYNQNK